MKRKILWICLLILLIARSTAAATLVDFGDLALVPNSYWNGPDPNGVEMPDPDNGPSPVIVGSFSSHGASFVNRYHSSFDSWDGFAYSNTTDTTTPGSMNQYSAITGTGRDGIADNYAVAYGHLDQTPNLYQDFAFDPTDPAQLKQLPYFTVPIGLQASSLYITNTTYAALSMLAGDPFAKKFGGPSGDDPDFLKLNVYGTNAAGAPLNATVDFKLADYTFADSSQDYVVSQWTKLDLSPLAGATRLYFNLSSSDVGIFGMNTPAYFALDDLLLTRRKGDLNLDGKVDGLDLPAMLRALSDLQKYESDNGLNNEGLTEVADIDGNGAVTNSDIQSLIDLLANTGNGSLAAVPEPGSLVLGVMAALAIARSISRQSKFARRAT